MSLVSLLVYPRFRGIASVAIVLYRMLDALAGRTEPSNVKGTILVDGQRPPSNFKFMTGYVVQVTTMLVVLIAIVIVSVAVAVATGGSDF